MNGWNPRHDPGCRLYDPSAGPEASVTYHWRNCILPRRLLAELPRELRFEVPVEMARDAARIGWLAVLTAHAGDYLPGETIGEREMAIASRALAGRIGTAASPGDLWPGDL